MGCKEMLDCENSALALCKISNGTKAAMGAPKAKTQTIFQKTGSSISTG